MDDTIINGAVQEEDISSSVSEEDIVASLDSEPSITSVVSADNDIEATMESSQDIEAVVEDGSGSGGGGGTTNYPDLTNKPKIGGVELVGDKSLNDIGAAAKSHSHKYSEITEKPTSFPPSSHNHDGVYLKSYTETDPTVPSWAKQPSKPTYSALEVGALPDTTFVPDEEYINGLIDAKLGVIENGTY